MIKKEKYILAVGDKDAQRLEIMNRILNPNSQQFIKKYIRPGMQILEVGCGVGIMTCWLAQQVGNKGKVVAVDSSQEQLDIVKLNATRLDLNNIEYIKSDLNMLDDKRKFDVCYSRYLMLHLQEPINLLSKYKTLVTNSGNILLEEPIISDTSTYPVTNFWDLLLQFYIDLSHKNSVDPDIGKRLYGFVLKNKLNVIDCNAVQAIISREEAIEYHDATIFALKDIIKETNPDTYLKFKNFKSKSINFDYARYMNVIQLAVKKKIEF